MVRIVNGWENLSRCAHENWKLILAQWDGKVLIEYEFNYFSREVSWAFVLRLEEQWRQCEGHSNAEAQMEGLDTLKLTKFQLNDIILRRRQQHKRHFTNIPRHHGVLKFAIQLNRRKKERKTVPVSHSRISLSLIRLQ